ncbi:MAG: XRE family transcriptional regulator [Actinomycetota bacterium]|nr:MAG: XRE family transcriptional regulator [Actinomycetota bacterium]
MAETAPRPRSVPMPDDAPTAAYFPAAAKQEPLWRQLLGDQLRQLRHGRGETLGDTARRAGVSPQYLSEIERGIKDPSSEMIAAVAGALDVTLIDLTLAVSESLRTIRASVAPLPSRRTVLALAA